MIDRAAMWSLRTSAEGVVARRGFFRSLGWGIAGAAGLPFMDLMALHADELRQRRMAFILLWMAGGPSQFDTFDPKPEHENGGGTKVIDTAIPGVQVAEYWPKVAGALKDIALIRSMSNKEGNHQRATYQLHTGYMPTGTLKHPNIGCSIAAELGDPQFDLPHQVSIGGGAGVPGAGFLGVAHEPFQVPDPTKPPTNVKLPVAQGRFQRRLGLLSALERDGYARAGGADRVRDQQELYKQTAAMILSPRMKAFDLEEEPSPLRDAYGRNAFGQGCLLARRLVEAGVTFVEVKLNGWDTHGAQGNRSVPERISTLAGQADPAFATLVTDLKERGLLDHTLVLWMGEFGRTPKVNPNGGRDHYPRVFNVALAGGGVRGGQVIGASNPSGTEVKDRPVGVNDLLTTLCAALKIDPAQENMTPVGRPMKIVDGGSVVRELFG
jgi:hypothetical protein